MKKTLALFLALILLITSLPFAVCVTAAESSAYYHTGTVAG